jgi:hypothetical protein
MRASEGASTRGRIPGRGHAPTVADLSARLLGPQLLINTTKNSAEMALKLAMLIKAQSESNPKDNYYSEH